MTRSKNKKVKKRSNLSSFTIVLSSLTIVILFLTYVLPRFFLIPHENDKYSFIDSKYSGIQTATLHSKTDKIEVFIEYPVSKNRKVNSTVSKYVKDIEDTFYAEISKPHFLPKKKPYVLNISYQVKYNSKGFISIIINSNQKTQEKQSLKLSKYWTFNMTTGSVVSLKDLFSDTYSDGIARTVLYIQKSLRDQIKPHGPDEESLIDNIKPDDLNTFIASGKYDMEFVFNPGQVARPDAGSISVDIPADRLQLFMQNNLARDIFSTVSFASPSETATTTSLTDCKIKKCIALTFDDGPSAYTSSILDTLSRYSGRATFFLIGKNVEKRPDMARRIAIQGSEIASHSWNHPALPTLSPTAINDQIIKTNNVIKAATNVDPKLIRPPYGAIDQTVSMEIAKNSMSAILWSVDTRDWSETDSNIIYNRVITDANRGSIVILHEVHKPTVDALEKIVKKLSREGYKFVTVSDLLGNNLKPGGIYYHS